MPGATDAVTATAVARREARASLDRMEYHLGRGTRGARGVAREVRFLDALHSSTVRQTGASVGAKFTGSANFPLGQKAVSALSGGNSATIGRMKSSILADFSADALQGPRSIGSLESQWRWTANASACPSCLDRHGQPFSGDFVPLHPSCLCIPQPTNTPGLRPLSDGELVEMAEQYGSPRYGPALDKFKNGDISRNQLSGVEAVNTTPKGLGAVGEHLAKSEVSQTGLTAGVADDTSVVRKLANPDTDISTADFHRPGGEWTPERAALHDDIIKKVLADVQAVDDPVFYMTGGGPASGKSTMLQANTKRYPKNMAHVDADQIKGYLPEYRDLVGVKDPRAAAFAHDESSYLAKRLLSESAKRDFNVLYDTVGDSGLEGLRSKVATARLNGRKVVADYASNDLDLALKLAQDRAVKTGRTVPDYIIRTGHSDVTDTFLRAVKDGNIFDEARLWDTNIYQKPRLIGTYTKGGKFKVKDWELFEDFVSKGTRDYDEVLKDLGLRGPRQPKTAPRPSILNDGDVRIVNTYQKEVLQREADDWWRALSVEKREAVYDYTGAHFDPINRRLLGKAHGSRDFSAARLDEMTEDIRESLSTFTHKDEIVTWRRINKRSEWEDNLEAALKGGGEVEHVPFASTSVRPGVAMEVGDSTYFFVEMQTKSCAYVGNYSKFKSENEWIVPDGTKFRVLGKKEIDYLWEDPVDFLRTKRPDLPYNLPYGTDLQKLVNETIGDMDIDEARRWIRTRQVWQVQEI